MFERNDEVRAAIDRVFVLFDRAAREDVITWTDIENVAGYSRSENEGRFRYIQQQARKRALTDLSIATRVVTSVGVKLLSRNDQVIVCSNDRTRRAFRSFGRGKREVDAVDGGSLTDHMRRLQNLVSTSLRDNRRTSRAALKQAAAYVKTETLPKRPSM